MKRIILLFVFILQWITMQNAYAQTATDEKQQLAALGDFPVENGQHIAECKIGYRTFGKLNSTRSNAVIYPTSGGITTYMMHLFGMGAEVDTTRFYLILIDALGNGVSSSPSNSIRQPKTLFPEFNIRDVVNTQYKMLTEKMNIHHVTAIVGGSMGGLQALQWAVSYPDFMDKLVSIEGTPKVTTYNLLWMQNYMDAVKTDTAYQGGNYKTNPATSLAIQMTQLLLTSPAMMNNSVPVDSFSIWLASLKKPNPYSVDCNNFLWQTKAVMKQDITAKAGGSLENTAKTIKAKMLIIANKQDHTINQTNSIKLAGFTKSELIVMDDDLGHLVFSQKTVIDATRKFLSE